MTKLISITGDSISTFEGITPPENSCYYSKDIADVTGIHSAEDTWWMQVIEALGGQLLSNGAFSSSMVEGISFPAGSSMQRARQILGPNGEVPDIVIVFAGINDYGWGGALAQAKGRSSFKPVELDLSTVEPAEPELAPEDALTLFADAYIQMLTNLKSVAPNAQIVCMTLIPGRVKDTPHSTFCYSLRGIDIDAYNDAIKHAAHACGCDVADIRAIGSDYQSVDGTHPDEVGMAQIADMVLAAMGEIPVSPRASELSSDRYCFKPNCIGCEYADSTDSKWSCVCLKPYDN